MSDDIPYAQPFPWATSTDEPQQNATRSLRKRKFVGSGLAVLRKESLGSESKMGNVAKNILMNLFHQHGIEVDGEMESDANKFNGIGLSEGSLRIQTPTVSKKEIKNISDDETSLKTESGKKSFLIELLKAVIESSNGIISTRHILRKVCLLLQPGTLPGIMDSKDMVLAALHFLSSKSETQSDHILWLPLIRPLQAFGDLEKRNFEKVGDWRLEDIEEKLLKMEEVFLSSPSSWKWQKRESLSLRLSKANEDFFFMKGTIPLCATAKKVKGEGIKKRKAAVKKTKTDFPAGVVEASIDDAVASNDDRVVEAIILDEVF